MPKAIFSREHRTFTELRRKLREDLELRQQDVADRLGCIQSYVSKYESGERRIDVLELREICAVLGLDLVEFAKQLEKRLAKPK